MDAVSFAMYTCRLGRSVPLALANIPAAGDAYQQLLAKFPALTVPTFSAPVAKHGVEHHLATVGPLAFARARCLDAAKLAIAKKEFAAMERLGIVRHSETPWASPLHMVPKADGSCRTCGDFRHLNNFTTCDRYPIPTVDLVRGYHQVPVHPQDVSKTAVITPFGLFEFLQMLWPHGCGTDLPTDNGFCAARYACV